MAVPAYLTDLVDITLAESTTGWVSLGGGTSGLEIGTDFAMQGTYCVDKRISSAEKGQVYTSASPTTFGAGEHVFVWVFLATPGLANTLANRGLGVVIGTSVSAYTTFHVEGSDTYGAVGRVGKCYPIRYTNTASTSPPYRTLTGSPTTSAQVYGATANITGSVKGSNLGVDAIRRGWGVQVLHGDTATPATFTGLAAMNDARANRWGVFTFIAGSTYELQGRLSVGLLGGTPVPTYFNDSNKSIILVDTPHSLPTFTQIIVDDAGTVFNLTNVTIEAAGTHNPGQLIYNNAGTSSALTGCRFVRLGISTLRAGVVATSTVWQGCGQITTNGATMTNSSVISSTATQALVINSVAESNVLSYCDFSDNNRAILITAPGTYTFSGHRFSGNMYDIENSSAGLVTINATHGCNVSTFINTGGGTTVINNQVTLTLTDIVDGSEVRIYLHGTTTELGGVESVTGNQYVFTYNYTPTTYVDIVVHNLYYQYYRLENYLLGSIDATLSIQQSVDRQYSNPT